MQLDMGVQIMNSPDVDKERLQELHDYLGDHVNYIYDTGMDIVEYRYCRGYVLWNIPCLDVGILKRMKALDNLNNHHEHFQKLMNERNFKGLFNSIDRVIAMKAYIHLFEDIPDEDKYSIFRKIYVNKEYNFDDLSLEFFESILSYRQYCEEWKRDMEFLRSKVKEDVIWIYRGEGTESTPSDYAFSWSLSQNVAKFFARRFSGGGTVLEGTLELKDVCDYIHSNNEEEILVIPGSVQNIEEIAVYKSTRNT